MDHSRQELLKKLKEFERIRNEKEKRMSFLAQCNPSVREYLKHQSDVVSLQRKIETTMLEIQNQCHHVWYQMDFFRDNLTISNIWSLQCIACGRTTDITQNEYLDKKPYYPHIIYKDNKAGLSFEDAKKMYDEFEKQEGPEKAAEYVLSLSRTSKGLK